MTERKTYSQLQPLTREEELRVITAAKDGDTNAMGTLYDHHVNNVYRLVAYWLHDECRSEDVTAEVFIKAFRGLPSYRDKKVPLKAWLMRIARNEAINNHRAYKKDRHQELQDYFIDPDENHNPQESLERKEEISNLKTAITQLSQAQQEVIAYRFGLELSYEETAEIIGKSVIAVKLLRHRGLQKLRKIMRENEGAVVS